MNINQEQQRIEKESKRRSRENQTKSQPLSQEQKTEQYANRATEKQIFHPTPQDKQSSPEPDQTILESGQMFSSKTKTFAAHKWFVGLALIFGITFVFLTPPFQAPDEIVHFLKSYMLSDFRLVAQVNEGSMFDEMDSEVMDFVFSFEYLAGHSENKTSIKDIAKWNGVYPSLLNEKEEIRYSTIDSYNILYLPQAFGMAIAHLLGMSVLWTFFMGRLFNLFFYVAMMYLAIKTTPIGKNIFFLLALLPMAVFLAASLSYDVMVISVCALFIAVILNLSYDPQTQFTKQSFVTILVLGILLFFVKTVYFPLVLLVLAIPAEKFSVKKGQFRLFLLIIVATLVVYASIMIFRKFIYAGVVTRNTMTMDRIITILTNPIHLLKVMHNTFQIDGSHFTEEFIGKLGWRDVILPGWIIGFYYIVLSGALFEMSENEIGFIRDYKFSDTIRLFVLTVISLFGFLLLLIAVFYYIMTEITLKKEGAIYAEGIQGRYFIPVAYLALTVLAAMINYKISFGNKFYQITKILNVVFVVVVQVVSIIAVATRYYI